MVLGASQDTKKTAIPADSPTIDRPIVLGDAIGLIQGCDVISQAVSWGRHFGEAKEPRQISGPLGSHVKQETTNHKCLTRKEGMA